MVWGQPAPNQPGRKVLEHLQRPFLAGCRGNPRGLSCTDEEQERKNRATGHLYPLTTSTPKKGGNPRLGHSLVKQENVRPRWVLLYPTHCPVAKGKSMALCTEVHAGPQMPGPCAGLREGGRGRMTADFHLFSIRICTLCTRSRASCRICFALCRSAISLKNLMMSVKSILFSRMMSR